MILLHEIKSEQECSQKALESEKAVCSKPYSINLRQLEEPVQNFSIVKMTASW
jgi:hypothetical protein